MSPACCALYPCDLLSVTTFPRFYPSILHDVSTFLSFTTFPRFYPSRRFHAFILHGVSTLLSFTAFPRFYPSRPSESGSRLEGDDLKYGNCNGSRLQSYSYDIGACPLSVNKTCVVFSRPFWGHITTTDHRRQRWCYKLCVCVTIRYLLFSGNRD